MTDILTRLAALAAKDEAGLLLSSCCATIACPTTHGFGNYSVECGCGSTTNQRRGCNAAIDAWNSRPREAALIALVQEAAAEIERLRAALQKHHRWQCEVGSAKFADETGEEYELDLSAEYCDRSLYEQTVEALRPQEAIS